MVNFTFKDNARDFLRELAAEAKARAPHVKVGNDAPHARYLQFKRGFVVVDDPLLQAYLDVHLRRVVDANEPMTTERLHQAVQIGVDQFVARMQAFTSKLRPPVKAGGPLRPAHPGGWGDVTTELASSYYAVFDGVRKDYDYSGRVYA